MSPLPKERFKTDPRDCESPFGVLDFLAWNHSWNNDHYALDQIEQSAALMAGAGIRWVRMDFLWADLEPTPGQFEFERYDAILEVLAEHHLKTLGLLHYNPTWRDVPWNSAPDPDDYLRYAQAVCAHFKDRVRYWEIWNEPDQDIYWVPQDGMDAYSELLRKVYPALKKEDPSCRILLGGLSKEVPQRLREVYEKTRGDCFDIVNLHPFVSPLSADPLGQLSTLHDAVRQVMVEFGDSAKPIWWTEIGCPGIPAGVSGKGWWLGKSPTEDEQAAWLQTLFSHRSRWAGVEKIFWAFFRDTQNHFHDDVDHLGLVRHDLFPKPALKAYRETSGGV